MRYLFLFFTIIFLASCVTNQANRSSLAEAARLNTQMGLMYLNQKDLAQAENKLFLAKQQNPQDVYVWLGLAYFFQKTGRPQQALKNYHEALRLSPHDPQALNNYAAFLCQQKQYARALKLFNQLLAKPDLPHEDQVDENAAICAKLSGDAALTKFYEGQMLAIRGIS